MINMFESIYYRTWIVVHNMNDILKNQETILAKLKE